jgi:hypothetical protein
MFGLLYDVVLINEPLITKDNMLKREIIINKIVNLVGGMVNPAGQVLALI